MSRVLIRTQTIDKKGNIKTASYEGELFGDYYNLRPELEPQQRSWGSRIGFLVTHKDKCYLHLTDVRRIACEICDDEGEPMPVPPDRDTYCRDFDVATILELKPVPVSHR